MSNSKTVRQPWQQKARSWIAKAASRHGVPQWKQAIARSAFAAALRNVSASEDSESGAIEIEFVSIANKTTRAASGDILFAASHFLPIYAPPESRLLASGTLDMIFNSLELWHDAVGKVPVLVSCRFTAEFSPAALEELKNAGMI